MKRLLFLFLALCTPICAAPNFVFFITDDISASDLGCYGNEVIQTPNLDAIAENGLVFDNAHNVISSCSPSRCAIITGRYPHNTGAPELHSTLPDDQVTFVRTLREAGYHTIISGKNHMNKPAKLGFDESSDSKPAGSENWIQHLKDRPKEKPFFAWFASHDAHYPMTFTDEAPTYDPNDIEVPPMLFDAPGTRQELANYYHEVSRTDHFAGELMKELKAQGIDDETYFIYCADNGRPFPRCKSYLYNSGTRTPLLIAGPKVKAGRTDALVSSIDYAPTILSLAGVDIPPTVQGVSFEPTLIDPSTHTREIAISERNWHVYQLHERSVRFGDWLYIWNAWPERHNVSGETSWLSEFPAAADLWSAAKAGKLTDAQALLTKLPQPQEMLFNVKDDPHQFQNLAHTEAHQVQLDQARSLLKRWKEETGDSIPADPTRDRDSLHEKAKGKTDWSHREFPGTSRNATQINQPGPVKLTKPAS